MRIVMVTNNYTPFSGGVVSSLNAFIGALQAQGHHVTLVTLNFLGDAHDDPVWVKRIWCPIRFMYKTNHMAIPWRAKAQLNNIISQIRPDIVHVHHPFLLGPAANAIAKKQHIPVVFTYHTVYEAYSHYIPMPKWLVKRWITSLVLSFCHAVDGIIAPSGYMFRYLKQKGIKTPIMIIPSPLQAVFSHKQIAKEPPTGW